MATIVRPPTKPLARCTDMISVMQDDLKDKVLAAATGSGAPVHGVFSIDDLETKTAADLCGTQGGHAFGVMYMGATGADGQLNTDRRSNAAQTQDYFFGIVLASPSSAVDNCSGDTSTELLTRLRQAILGTPVTDTAETRTWQFVKEGPEISASTRDVLYYLQVWRLVLIGQGNINSRRT